MGNRCISEAVTHRHKYGCLALTRVAPFAWVYCRLQVCVACRLCMFCCVPKPVENIHGTRNIPSSLCRRHFCRGLRDNELGSLPSGFFEGAPNVQTMWVVSWCDPRMHATTGRIHDPGFRFCLNPFDCVRGSITWRHVWNFCWAGREARPVSRAAGGLHMREKSS